MEQVGENAELTICGGVSSEIDAWLGDKLNRYTVHRWMPRNELQKHYLESDVLVFPTLEIRLDSLQWKRWPVVCP